MDAVVVWAVGWALVFAPASRRRGWRLLAVDGLVDITCSSAPCDCELSVASDEVPRLVVNILDLSNLHFPLPSPPTS